MEHNSTNSLKITKEEFNAFLVEIDGLKRTYREDKGPILAGGWVGEGWNGLLKNLIEELLRLGWNKRVNSIKEKFGGLRVYIDNEDMPAGGYEIISKYERLSYKVCEKCGADGVLRSGSWLKTLCDEHAEGKEPFDAEKLKKIFGY